MDNTMEHFDAKRQIAVIWDIDDVQSIRRDLTEEQALAVLLEAKRKHDAELGINWDVLKARANELFPNYEYDEDDYKIFKDICSCEYCATKVE